MRVIPAIDLKDGQCVRLQKGDYGTAHKVAENPVETAQRFLDAGADLVHMVDLDAAKDGSHANYGVVEQVIRPTGLLDPEVVVRPVDGQIDDLIGEINARTAKGERVLVTTLTKKMAEDLTDYLETAGIKVRYMHHDVKTIERQELVRDLRLGVYDVLVGINLLREGLDIPEVSLVAILDADKEGFLRSETSLIQTIGRAARNEHGMVVLYADSITPSMKRAMDETERRRALQDAFNKAHGIIPRSVHKKVQDVIEITSNVPSSSKKKLRSKGEKQQEIARLTRQMKEAAKMLEFEIAAQLRDQIKALENG